MPSQGSIEPGEFRRRLTDWLATRLPAGTGVEIGDLDAPSETGHSSETVLFDAVWSEEGIPTHHHLVLRTAPGGHTVFPLYDMAMQARVMEAVALHSAVPVPRVRFTESDPEPLGSPFLIMDRVDGLVPPDNLPYTMQGWLLAASPAQQSLLQSSTIDILADLHALDWESAGLGFLGRDEYGPTSLESHLGWYRWFLEWTAPGDVPPLLADTLGWLETHVPSAPGPDVLLWGDARIGNVIYRNFEPVAVLDWEMARLGPREFDLSWMCLFFRFFSDSLGVPDLPGFVGPGALVERYRERSGATLSDLSWYETAGAFEYAVIMMRLIQAAELAGGDPGFTQADNPATSLLRQVRDRPSFP